MKTSDL